MTDLSTIMMIGEIVRAEMNAQKRHEKYSSIGS